MVEGVRLMREVVGPKSGVKAAGGIRAVERALQIIEAGANRIGASASVSIVERLKPSIWQMCSDIWDATQP